MKALTLHQPWASLIAVGAKTIETRSWRTDYRGPLAIHAGKQPIRDAAFDEYGWIGSYNRGRWTQAISHVPECGGACEEDDSADERCMDQSPWEHALFSDEGAHGLVFATSMPLGAVVASATLIDCVPIVAELGCSKHGFDHRKVPTYIAWSDRHQTATFLTWRWTVSPTWYVDKELTEQYRDQVPFGDFSPGRFAWLLGDVKPTTERCPWCMGKTFFGCATCSGFGFVQRHQEMSNGPSFTQYLACPDCRCPVCCIEDERGIAHPGSCDPVPAKGRQGLWSWTPEKVPA